MDTLSFYLITGLSGAGKSHALQAFEDMGFYCVDNLPSELVESLATLFEQKKRNISEIAIVLDVREGDIVADFPTILETLRSQDLNLKVLFLESSKETLLQRYKESRRPHPLGKDRSIEEAIEDERKLLGPLREEADMVIDTTDITVHQFRGLLTELHQPESADRFTLSLTSFGFKHGAPAHLDTLFDARFLPNPHYETSLQELTGVDAEVAEFMEDSGLVERYLDQIKRLLELLVGAYYPQGKTVLSVGVGCTGGQHRSVYLVQQLAKHFNARTDCRAVVTHRDMKQVEVS